jgi:hypothetical protein
MLQGGNGDARPGGRERSEELRDQITLWVGDRRLSEAMDREELAQLEGFQRVLALRNGVLSATISYIRNNPRADVTLGVLAMIGFLCDNNDGLCRVGIRRMAEIFKRTERAVHDVVKRLKDANLIGVVEERGKSRCFWIKIPKEMEHVTANAVNFVTSLSDRPTPARYQPTMKNDTGSEVPGSNKPQQKPTSGHPPSTPEADFRCAETATPEVEPAYSSLTKGTEITLVREEDRGCGGKDASPSASPSLRKPQPEKPSKPHELPEGWTPGRVGHHRARGTKFKDWHAAWRTWCRNGAEYRKKSRGGGPGKGRSGPASMDELVRRATEGGGD